MGRKSHFVELVMRADMRGGGYASCRGTGGQVRKNVMCRPRVDGLEYAAGDALGNLNNIK